MNPVIDDLIEEQHLSRDQFYDMAIDLWHDAQDYGCSCHMGHPPCSHCTNGYSVSVDEFIEFAMDDWDAYHKKPLGQSAGQSTTETDAERYDRAMGIFS